MKILRALLLAACSTQLLLITACCCCGGPGLPLSPEDRERLAKEREAREAEEAQAKEEALARAPVLAASYQTIHQAIDLGAAFDKVACPDDALRVAEKVESSLFRMELWTVDYASLPGVTRADKADWEWLNHSDIANLAKIGLDPSGEHSEYTLENVGNPEHRYLAVFVTEERSLPGKVEKKFLAADEFDSGYFAGSLVVVDLEDRKTVCSVPFEAENSDEIDDDGGDWNKIVLKDFKQNVEDRGQEALETISGEAKINVVGIF